MSAVVYFVPPERATEGVGTILEASGYFKRLRPKKRIGIKVHFGEHGNNNHLRPDFVRAAALAASYYNLQPVVIETTALYRGRRQEATEHLKLAREHGFTIGRILAPIEILDGRHGERSYRVPLDSALVPAARLAPGRRGTIPGGASGSRSRTQMLILTRRVGEAILMDGGIRIVVLGLEGGGVRLGIDAPASVGIVREEIAQRGLGEEVAADGAAIPGDEPSAGQAHGPDR